MSETHASTEDHYEPGSYEIRIEGHLVERWADWFEGLTITLEDNGDTLLSGPVADQAALHGLLKKVRDLGMPLLSVSRKANPSTALGTGQTDASTVKQQIGASHAYQQNSLISSKKRSNKMNTNRKIAIIVGILFLTATATFMLGDDALTGSILDNPDYLVSVSENRTQVITGMLIAFIDSIAVVSIAVLLFPILKQHNEPVALGYVGLRITECVIIIAYLISPLVLITLSQEYVKAGAPDASYFQTLGALFQAGRYWAIQLIYILNGLAGLLLTYVLYQSKLIPRSISVLGLIGYALLLPGALLDVFGHVDTLQGAGMIVFLPGALFEILLPIWLIVKGFNSAAINSGSAQTDINAG